MTTDKVIAGIQILLKYYDNPEGYHIGAEHDEIYVYATDKPVSDEDLARLVELGWEIPETEGDSWHTFV